jgi:phosphoribosylformimino-5-aminoimidazole carboxamide ribotide isomerase
MRVVPVIDLKDGTAVHAVRGERERYRPVHSVITPDDGDPLALTRAFRSELGLDELYVADLDAIAGGPGNADVVAALAREGRAMVDAGTATPATVARLLELSVACVVIGTETLPDPAAFRRLRVELPDAPLVLSLDLRAGRVLSPDRELARLSAADALARFADAGAREAIVLDLARVGSGAGPDVALLGELHARFPELELLAGGGVRHVGDLRALAEAGAAGALVATALHDGAIRADELRALR